MAASAPTAVHAQTQDLFVSNAGGNTISRFAGTGPGTFSTTATPLSASSLNNPTGLAFDARGDLFAANTGGSSITEFAFNPVTGTFGAGTSFTTGGQAGGLIGLAFDAGGDLFAATGVFGAFRGGIEEFPSTGVGTFGTTKYVGSGLNEPSFLAFGASVSAPVPEASTTVSLGLLLALGMGGLVVAARRKRRA